MTAAAAIVTTPPSRQLRGPNARTASLTKATITAPTAGVVESVNIVAGADAPSGLAIVLDTGGLQASVTIAETDLPKVKVGQAASVTVGAVDSTTTGKVLSIAPTATGGNSSVVTYAVVVSTTGFSLRLSKLCHLGLFPSSCPGLSRASTSCFFAATKTWMAGTSSAKTRFALLPGHDEST